MLCQLHTVWSLAAWSRTSSTAFCSLQGPVDPEATLPPHSRTFEPEPDKIQMLMSFVALLSFKCLLQTGEEGETDEWSQGGMAFMTGRGQSRIFTMLFKGKWESLHPVSSIFVSYNLDYTLSVFPPHLRVGKMLNEYGKNWMLLKSNIWQE